MDLDNIIFLCTTNLLQYDFPSLFPFSVNGKGFLRLTLCVVVVYSGEGGVAGLDPRLEFTELKGGVEGLDPRYEFTEVEGGVEDLYPR